MYLNVYKTLYFIYMYITSVMYITLEKCPNILTVVSNIHNIQAFYK